MNLDAVFSPAAVAAAERTLTFMGMEGTRLPGTENVDVQALLRAAVEAARREATS